MTEIIKGLTRRGWHVKLYEPNYGKNGHEPSIGVRILNFVWVQLKFFVQIGNQPDVVYARSHVALLPVTLLCRFKKIPIIHEVNGPYEDWYIAWPITKKFSWLVRASLRLQYKVSSLLVTVTPGLGSWLRREVGPQKIQIIPNAANIDLFTPDAVSKRELSKPYALFFGALASWQGIDTMLEAVALDQWPQKVHLVIVGDGATKNQVVRHAKNNRKLHYLGKLPYKELPGIISNAMVSLSPQANTMGRSNTGLFPLKVFESLSAGTPVVVSDFPGQADLVKQYQCGLVIPPENPAALAQAVSYLDRHPEMRQQMGTRGRKAVMRDHSWDKRAADTHKAIRSLTN